MHAETIVVAEALPGRGPARDLGALPHTFEAVRRWIERQPDRKTRCIAYEAGPTGFGLARWCAELGVTGWVVAPGLVPRRPTDRVTTDRRDARPLALDLRTGLLTPIRVPTAEEEAFRDLVRARTRAVDDRRHVEPRIRSTLLRWGIARPAGAGRGRRAFAHGCAPLPPRRRPGPWSGKNSERSSKNALAGSPGWIKRSKTPWRPTHSRAS